MPLQNRVTPFSTIEAVAHRGLFMGNRGCLHDGNRNLIMSGWRHKNWIICNPHYKGITRCLMTPGQYTELFFLDEAVALAAGHRPCALCRRPAYNAFRRAWTVDTGDEVQAVRLDAILHAERLKIIRDRQLWPAKLGTLATGAFVVRPDQPDAAWLVVGDELWRWSHAGYSGRVRLSAGTLVNVLTPQSIVRVLKAGYCPALHPTVNLTGSEVTADVGNTVMV